jgi:hypothetical protein
VSRKSAPFTAPGGAAPPDGAAGRRRSPEVIDARVDEWVSDRNTCAKESHSRPGPSLVLDLAAERSLTEIFALSMLTPITLGWFWLMCAMSGRARF